MLWVQSTLVNFLINILLTTMMFNSLKNYQFYKVTHIN